MTCGCISAGWKKRMNSPETAGYPDTAAAPACIICGRTLSRDEIGMTKKMINRGAERYFCLACLARKFDVSEEILQDKIRQFREMGCTLFTNSGKTRLI